MEDNDVQISLMFKTGYEKVHNSKESDILMSFIQTQSASVTHFEIMTF